MQQRGILIVLGLGVIVASIHLGVAAASPASNVIAERWTKFDAGSDGNASNDNVITPGGPGSWDQWCYYPSVVQAGGLYRMWYTGWDGQQTRIGTATSVDGAIWQKLGGPLLEGYSPTVIRDGDVYKMWYGSNNQLYFADSLDGVTWTARGSVLSQGTPGAWDATDASWATVVKDGATYRMWYGGQNGGGVYQIGYATSADGLAWTKYDVGSNSIASDDVVLDVGSGDAWDSAAVNDPTVVRIGALWHMWYHGESSSDTLRIGHATSADGVNWTKYDQLADGDPSNDYVLDVGDAGAWDQSHVWSPSVLLDGDQLKMWYTGWSDLNPGRQTGLALMPITAVPEPSLAIGLAVFLAGVFMRGARHQTRLVEEKSPA
jgi:predicted GH43/DUF377 family glycosyl hydrolase